VLETIGTTSEGGATSQPAAASTAALRSETTRPASLFGCALKPVD